MVAAEAIEALAALAHEVRLEIFRLLVQAGPAGLAAGDIRDRVGIPATTLSFHLAQLGHADLVSSRKAGRSVIYVANYAAMQTLVAFLTENCCQLAPAAPQVASGIELKRKKH